MLLNSNFAYWTINSFFNYKRQSNIYNLILVRYNLCMPT